MRKFLIYMFIVFILTHVALYFYFRTVAKKYENPQALLLIMDGDKVVGELPLKNKFVFLLKANGVFYGDTSQGDFYKAEYSNLSALGEEHRKLIKKYVE